MSPGGPNLTGRWTGIYFYPVDPAWNANDNLPATPFTAELTDLAGSVTGTTTEPDNLGPPGSPPIPATLEGHHLNGELTFTKFPDGGGQTHSIDYIGTISGDGNSVSGRWIIHGDWSGTFQMQRKVTPVATELEQTASVAGSGRQSATISSGSSS